MRTGGTDGSSRWRGRGVTRLLCVVKPGAVPGWTGRQPRRWLVSLLFMDIRAGRDEALSRLFEVHYADMVRLAFYLTGSWAVAEELAQEAFVRLWRRWGWAARPARRPRQDRPRGPAGTRPAPPDASSAAQTPPHWRGCRPRP